MKKIKVRSYKKFEKDAEFFFDDMKTALDKYVKLRNSIPCWELHQPVWPTIWINTGNGFVRVHDFTFWEANPKTIQKYLDERIIDSDDLLADFS